MQTLRLGGVLFVVLAVISLIVGGVQGFLGAQASDNVCEDDGADPCRGRDLRALGFRQTSEFFLWGGFLTLGLAAVMFLLAARTERAA